jgi:DNA-directed RNA polymerase specialized sigma24 family protein
MRRYFFDRATYKEIAEEEGMALDRVRRWIQRGLYLMHCEYEPIEWPCDREAEE